MLNENMKAIRKTKGLSQEELAIKLNVVRQTISKWEQGLSVPDSAMLISISEELETPVSTLLGETVTESKVDDLKAISEKLEIINLQLAQRKITRRKTFHWLFISLCTVIVTISAFLIALNSPYLGWNFSDPETAVAGAAFHTFEWLFVRFAPVILIGTIVGNNFDTEERIKRLCFLGSDDYGHTLDFKGSNPSKKRQEMLFFTFKKPILCKSKSVSFLGAEHVL